MLAIATVDPHIPAWSEVGAVVRGDSPASQRLAQKERTVICIRMMQERQLTLMRQNLLDIATVVIGGSDSPICNSSTIIEEMH